MISLRAYNYAKVLYSMDLEEDIVARSGKLLLNCHELMEVLDNPVVSEKEKETVVDALFHKDIASFIKVLCQNKVIGLFLEITEAYEEILLNNKNILKAKLTYAMKPEEEQIEQIKGMLMNKYNKTGVSLELEEDDSLIGGYVLHVGDTEYNKSIKGALSEMQKALIGR